MFSFSSTDLPSSLLRIVTALAAVAVIVGIVVWRGRRRGSKTIAIDAALTISGAWVMLSTLGVLWFVLKVFGSDSAEIPSAAVPASWPSGLPCHDLGSMTDPSSTMLACGGATLSGLTVLDASFGLRALAGIAQICALAFTTVPAAMLMVVCFQTLRGRAFSQSVTRALAVGAGAVLVLGIASDLLGGIATTAAFREVFPPDSRWYAESFQLTVTPLPFVGALGLIALAAVFRQGIRLQRERDALEKETEGLV